MFLSYLSFNIETVVNFLNIKKTMVYFTKEIEFGHFLHIYFC